MKYSLSFSFFIITVCVLLQTAIKASPIVHILSDKPLALCAGDSVQLTADICMGCAAPYTFKWYKNDSILLDSVQSIKVKSSGAYCVKVTCGTGCKVTQCVHVSVGFTDYQAVVTKLSCYQSHDGKIVINGPSNTSCRKYKLTWGTTCGGPGEFPAQTSNEFSGLEAGNYCVRVIDTCLGCDTCICVTVSQPPHDLTNINHTAFATYYTWAISGSTFTTSGIYTSTLQNVNGCDSVVKLHLTLFAPPTAPLIATVSGVAVSAGYTGDHGLASFAKFNNPNDIAYDKTKRQYFIADINNHRIRMIDSNGVVTTLAGIGVAGYNGDGGAAINAQIHTPVSVATDEQGNVYFSDLVNRRIRKVDANGIITTVIGTGVNGYNGENIIASSAQISIVYGISIDIIGNIYFSDYGSHRIRKIDANTGLVNTIAGTGTAGFSGDSALAINAQINFPYGLHVEANGNIYFADLNNNRIRKISTSGIISTVAGNGATVYNGDNINALSASLYSPSGVKTDDAGNIFIADLYHHRIRKVDVTNDIITTVAGNGTLGHSGDGGPSTMAQLKYPTNLCFDEIGNMLVCDFGNHAIRKVGIIDSPTVTKLNLSLYLQGYYISNGLMVPALLNQGVSNDPQACDSITVELHDTFSPYNIASSSQTLIYTNGNAVATFPLQNGAYYIAVKGRNALETWSAVPVDMSAVEIPMEYKTFASKAYGDNQTEVESGVWALYSGEINQDENIDLLDLGIVEADINNFIFGYFATDINGDGNVDLLDAAPVEANVNNFIFSSHP